MDNEFLQIMAILILPIASVIILTLQIKYDKLDSVNFVFVQIPLMILYAFLLTGFNEYFRGFTGLEGHFWVFIVIFCLWYLGFKSNNEIIVFLKSMIKLFFIYQLFRIFILNSINKKD